MKLRIQQTSHFRKSKFLLSAIIAAASIQIFLKNSMAAVYSPWVTSEHVADTFSLESFANYSAWKEKQGQDRAIEIWKYLCDKETGVFHFNPIREGRDRRSSELSIIRDPIKMLNCYGYGFCGAFGPTAAGIFQGVGFEKVRAVFIPGCNHCVTEVWYDDDWHYFDVDLRGVLFESDATTVASLNDLLDIPGLWTQPTKKQSPFFPGDADLSTYAQSYALKPYVNLYNWSTQGSTMDFRLRKGESLTRWWHPQGGRWSHQKEDVGGDFWEKLLRSKPLGAKGNHPDFSIWTHGNALFDYQPILRKGVDDFQDGVFAYSNVSLEKEGVALDADGQGDVIYEVLSPYVIVPKVGDFNTRADDSEASVITFKSRGKVQVSISTDFGRTWQPVKSTSGDSSITSIDLTTYLRERYQYLIKFALSGKSRESMLETLHIRTWAQVAPASLPRLKEGLNQLAYKTGDKNGFPTLPWMQTPNMANRNEMEQYWTLEPQDYDPDRVQPRVHGEIELRFTAPVGRKIKWASLGGFFSAYQGEKAPETENEIWYAVNDSKDWKQLYASKVPAWNNHWHYAIDREIMLEMPAESLDVRYIGDPGVNAIRVNLHSLKQEHETRQSVEVTHCFEMEGQLTQRRFTFDKPTKYTIDCKQTPTNIFVQFAVPSDSTIPKSP